AAGARVHARAEAGGRGGRGSSRRGRGGSGGLVVVATGGREGPARLTGSDGADLLGSREGESTEDDEEQQLLHATTLARDRADQNRGFLDGEKVAGAGVARGVAQLRHRPGLD